MASHAMQRYAVWFGGSVLGMMPEFASLCKTRAEYEECGPQHLPRQRSLQRRAVLSMHYRDAEEG